MFLLSPVATLLGALTGTHLARVVGVLFVLAMVALIAALVLFLREIYLAVNTVSSPLR